MNVPSPLSVSEKSRSVKVFQSVVLGPSRDTEIAAFPISSDLFDVKRRAIRSPVSTRIVSRGGRRVLRATPEIVGARLFRARPAIVVLFVLAGSSTSAKVRLW